MMSLDEAIARANAALEAGADIAFVEATQSVEEAAAVPKRVRGPCLLNIVPGGRTPVTHLRDAEAMGYKLAILPGLMLQSAITAGDAALAQLKATGIVPAAQVPIGETFRRFGADEWDALRQRFNAGARAVTPAAGPRVMGRTLFDRIWDAHVVRELGEGWSLLHVDRHLLHDLSGGAALAELAGRGLPVHDPALVAGDARPRRRRAGPAATARPTFPAASCWAALRDRTAAAGVRLYDVGQPGQGIVHVMGPELGIVLPGAAPSSAATATPAPTAASARSAFGVGSSESTHALATQTLRLQRPKTMRIRCDGVLGAGVTAKDLALHIIGRLGAAAGTGYAIEYAAAPSKRSRSRRA
jgi:hypothetical protein